MTHSAVNLYHDGKLEGIQITVDVVLLLRGELSWLLSCKSAKPSSRLRYGKGAHYYCTFWPQKQ